MADTKTYVVNALEEDEPAAAAPAPAAETEPGDENDPYEPRLATPEPRRRPIGRVSLDAEGRMTVLSTDGSADDTTALTDAVADLNAESRLFIKLPPEDGSNPRSLTKLEVKRGEERFFEALQDNLRRWHGMELAAS